MYILEHKDIMRKWDLVNKKTKGIDSFNTFPIFTKIIIAVIIILFILFIIPIKVLIAEDYGNGEYLNAWRIKSGFTISYIHSVELTEVLEIYSIEDDEIVLKETYFHSYGAGLPATTIYDFEMTSDGFRIFNIDEIMETLIYRTGAVRANHKLIIEDNEYEFLEFSNGQTAVHFQIKKMSFLEYFIKEVFE